MIVEKLYRVKYSNNTKRNTSSDLFKNKIQKDQLLVALFFDMVHDFMESGGIIGNPKDSITRNSKKPSTSNYKKHDYELLKKMFSIVFDLKNDDGVIKTINSIIDESKSVEYTLDKARKHIYSSTKKRFFSIKPRNNRSLQGNVINNYDKLKDNSVPLISSNSLYNALTQNVESTKESIPYELLIIEDAQKNVKAVPGLLDLIIKTQFGYTSKQVIPIESLPTMYNQASQKFPVRKLDSYRNYTNSMSYTLGDNIRVTLKKDITHMKAGYTEHIYSLLKKNDVETSLNFIHFFCYKTKFAIIKKALQEIIDKQYGKEYHTSKEFLMMIKKNYNTLSETNFDTSVLPKSSLNNFTRVLNTLFPNTSNPSMLEKFLEYKKTKRSQFRHNNISNDKLYNIDNIILQMYVSNSINILQHLCDLNNINKKSLYNHIVESSETYNTEVRKELKRMGVTCSIYYKDEITPRTEEALPSVKNTITKAREYILRRQYSSQNKVFTNLADSNTHNRSPVIKKSVSDNMLKILRSKTWTNDNYIKLFCILFSKTVGDLNQIVLAKMLDRTVVKGVGSKKFYSYAYFLTFDMMAALISLIIGSKTIFTGTSSDINDSRYHASTYSSKPGFSVIGPVQEIIKKYKKGTMYSPTKDTKRKQSNTRLQMGVQKKLKPTSPMQINMKPPLRTAAQGAAMHMGRR